MHIIKTTKDLQSLLSSLRAESTNVTIGLVPTMGALHAGHTSLITHSVSENDITVCSIFVNPTQFGEAADLDNYPKPIGKDIELLVEHTCDILFLPTYLEIYPENYEQQHFELEGLDLKIEGASRPGHFQGVCNVLARFFEIVTPTRAYFGQKDFQQTVVAKKLQTLLDTALEIKVVPIVRESHGLAMSSRNVRLSTQGRQNAAFIHRSLLQAKEDALAGMPVLEVVKKAKQYINAQKGAKVDYLLAVETTSLLEIAEIQSDTEVAIITVVEYEGVRLLDNIIL